MSEPFIITTNYKGKPLDIEVELRVMGYTHRFYMTIDGIELYFERDDEGEFRAILAPKHPGKEINGDLLRGIAEALEEVLK